MGNFQMFGQNIFLLLGILLVLAFGSVVFLVLVTAVRAFVFARQQRRAYERFRRQSRRADGQAYPPTASGVCDFCGRVSRLYFPDSGEKLCPLCYEDFWRRTG